ncbi:MAG: RluA family pseudouridine synthase [Polynucleobacter sp.]|jgi:23S rRNA pseudouridine955/2504/2580 synthase|nr:RluA family pseudouridine synthase [Polynucleobacter sp.]
MPINKVSPKPFNTGKSPDPQVAFVTIGPEEAGQRLDNFLLRWGKGVPKSHVYRIIRSGEVRVNKKRADPTTRLVEGDVLRLPPTRISTTPFNQEVISQIKAQALLEQISILFEDDVLMIINKPSGLAVHGGSGISLGAIELLRAARPELKFLELVHRLDRDTSGVLLLAKKRSALVEMHRQIREGLTDKRYRFVAHGKIEQGAHALQLKFPLQKYLLENGERRVRVDNAGQPSHTAIRVTEVISHDLGVLTLGEAQLKTGRTHQIRVHLQKIGHPILGDDKYGLYTEDRRFKVKRLCLHAHLAIFLHPRSGEKIRIDAPLPKELINLLLGWGSKNMDALVK